MISQKQIAFCFVLFFAIIFSFKFTFAQEDQYIENGPGFDATAGTNDTSNNTNIYLDNSNSNNTQTADNTTKTPAQVANGKLSGQYTGTKLSCPYAFERDLYFGIKGEDVRLLQGILNSDKRTIIATSGTASPGQETTLFGSATKEALKKFQALFIEYIGIANGRFGPRTRTVVNAICNGKATVNSGNSYNNVQNTNPQTNPQNTNTSTSTSTTTPSGPRDTVPPQVSLSANLNAVQLGDYFKVIVNTSKPILKFTPDSVIVDGGSVKDIRKLGPTGFTVTITPNDDARQVVVQIEAEKIQDLSGNVNDNASNEILVRVLKPVVVQPTNPTTTITVTPTATGTNPTDLTALLDKVISSAPSCTYTAQGVLITGANLNTTGCPTQSTASSSTGYYNCYGQQIPNNQQCPYDPNQDYYRQQQQAQQNQQAQQAGQGLGQMLGNLLRGGGGSGQQPNSQQSQERSPASTQQPPPSTQTPPADPAATTPTASESGCRSSSCSDRMAEELKKKLETSGGDPNSNGNTSGTSNKPEDGKVTEDLNGKCNYLYAGDPKNPKVTDTPYIKLKGVISNTSIIRAMSQKDGTDYYVFGDIKGSGNHPAVGECSTWSKEKIEVWAPQGYCCKEKQSVEAPQFSKCEEGSKYNPMTAKLEKTIYEMKVSPSPSVSFLPCGIRPSNSNFRFSPPTGY